MSFSKKVVIVTGGSSGIGAATALEFVKEGADVAIIGRNESRLNDVAEKCSKVGKQPLIIKADVSKDEEAKLIVEKTVNTYGKIDVLVNNAGVLNYAEVTDEKLVKVCDTIMNINFRSIVVLTNLAAPYLIKSKGNIVNISSIAGSSVLNDLGFGYAAYCSSKAALNQFSRSCAMELAEHGVRVNIVSPGPVETSIIATAGFDLDWNVIKDNNTALKILTQPVEVADIVLYLASDKAKSITGSNMLIDAGYSVNGKRN